MADRYWVGGTGTWGSTQTTNWATSSGGTAGASVPTAADNVIFDSLSNTGTNAFTVTMATSPRVCLNFDASAIDGVMTLAGSAIGLTISGSYITHATNYSPTYTLTTTFNSTTTGQTISSAVAFPGAVTFDGVGGGWTLNSNISTAATATTTLTNGALALGGYDLTTGIFSSSGSGTRSIAFGTNNIILAHTTAATPVLVMATATNFTYTGTGGFTSAMTVTRSFAFGSTSGGTSSNAPNLSLTSGTSIPTITSGSFFNTLNFTGSSTTPAVTALNLNALTLSSGGTYTDLTATFVGTGTFTSTGKSIAALTINHSGTTTLADAAATIATGTTTLTSGTLALNGFDLTTGIFSSTNSNTRAIAFGTNNIILNHSGAGNTVLAMQIATNFTYTGTGGFTSAMTVTRTFAFGSTSSSGTSSNAPNLSITSGTAVPSFTATSFFNTLNFTGSTPTEVVGNVTPNNLVLGSAGTYTSFVANLTGTTHTVNGNGNNAGSIIINNAAGTVTLTGTYGTAATATATTFTLTSGTLALNGFNLTTGIFSSTNSNTRVITFGTNNIILNHTVAGNTVLAMQIATGFTWTGTGGFTSPMVVSATFAFGSTSSSGTSSNAPNLSLTSGTAVPSFTATSFFNTLNFTGSTHTEASGTVTPNNLVLASGGTYTSLTVSFTGTTHTLNGNGNGGCAITINNAAGTVTLTGTYGTAATPSQFTLTAGTLDLGGYNLTTGIFNSSGAGVRAIAFGTNFIILNHTVGGNAALNMPVAGGFTYTGTGGFSSPMTVIRTFTFGSTSGGTAANAPNLSITSGTTVPTFTGTSYFNTLSFTGSTTTDASGTVTPNNLVLASGGTYTSLIVNFTGTTHTVNGNGNGAGTVTINNAAGTVTLTGTYGTAATATARTFTLTAGTLNLGGYDLTTGIFSSTNSNTRVITFGTNNIILNNTIASEMVLSMATATGFTYTGTGGFTSAMAGATRFQFGSLSGGTAANAPNLLLTLGSTGTAITSGSFFNTLNFTGSSATPSAATVNVTNLTLSTGGTYTSLSATFVSTGTFTSTGKTIAALTINHSGTTTLADAGSCTTYTQTAGTVNFATFNLTCSGAVAYTAGTLSNMGTITCTTWTIAAASTFTMTGGTITPSTSFVLTSGAFNFNGGTLNAPLFTHTAGTVTLGAAMTLSATSTYTLTAGDLVLGGFNLTTGIFSSSGSVTRSIAFGTNNIVLAHTTLGQTVLSMAVATGFTYTGTGGFTSAMTVTRTFSFGSSSGGTSSNAPNLSLTSGASIPTFTTGNFFNTLNFTGSSTTPAAVATLNVNTLTLTATGTYTGLGVTAVGTGTFTFTGKTIAAFVVNNGAGTTTFADAGSCTTYTQTAGTINFATYNLTCSGVVSYTAGALSNIGTITCTTWTIAAASTFTMTSGTITPSVSFVLTSGAFNYNGGTLSAVPTFTHTAGTVTLGQSYALTTNGTYTLTAGTLNLSGYNLTTGIFSSDNSSTRSILFGVGNIILTYNAGNTNVILMTAVTGFTWTGTGGFTATADISKTYAFGNASGGSAAGAPNLTFTGSGTSIQYITTNTWWNTLNFGTTAFVFSVATLNVASLTLSSGGTYTALGVNATNTGTLTTAGKTIAALTVNNGAGTTTLANAVSCTTYTQTAGTINFATYNLTCSGAVAYSAGTLSNIGTITCTTWTVTGTFTMTSGTITPSTSFVLTSGAFNYNGGTLSAVPTFTHTAGTVTLGQAYALTATGTYTLTAGTLSLGTYNLTTGIFSSSGSGTRSIAFGTGNIILAHTTAATAVLAMATATNFTYTGTGGFTSAMTVTRTFSFASTSSSGTSSNAPNLSLTSGSAVPTFTSSGMFGKLDFTGSSCTPVATTLNVNTLTLTATGTYTGLTINFFGTGTFTSTGKTIAGLTINHLGTTTLGDAYTHIAGGTTTLTSGTLALNGFDLTTGILSSSNSNTRAIAFGTNNIILAHTSLGQTNLQIAVATGFTYTGTGGFTSAMTITRTFEFGSAGGGTSSNAPNLSLTSGASIPTITTASWFNALNFTGSTCTPATSTVNVSVLTLATGGTYTNLSPALTSTQTWTSQFSKQLGGFGVNGTGITVTLGGSQSLTATSTTTLTAGTLNLGGYDLTTGIFSSTGTGVRSIAFGTNNIILAHTTVATVVLSMAVATNFTYTGTGGFTSAMTLTREFTFGTTGGTTTNAPNLALTSGTSIPTFTTTSYFGTLDFTGSSTTPAAASINVNTLTLTAGGTYTGLSVTFIGTGTFTSTGDAIAALTINHSGTTTFADAGSCTTYTQTAGAVNFATYNLTCSGAVAYTSGTLSNIGIITCTTWTVTGTFTLTQGTITPSTSFVLTSGAFNYNGGTLSAVPTFTHTDGTVTLGQSYTLTSTGTYTLTQGTLDLGAYTLTTGKFNSANLNGNRTIAFGTGNITLTSTGDNVWATATSNGLTTTGSKTVNVTNATATATEIQTGVMTEAQAVDFNFTSGTYTLTFLNHSLYSHSARNINFTGYSGAWSHDSATVYGSITYSDTMSVTDASKQTSITFAATSGTQILTPGVDVTIAAININCPGATVQLAPNTTTKVFNSLDNNTCYLYLTNGTLDLNGSTLDVVRFLTLAGTKNITFNAGILFLRSGVSDFSNNAPTGFTTSQGTASDLGYISMVGGTFSGGGSTFNCIVELKGTTTFTGSNIFAGLYAQTIGSMNLQFTASTTTTVTDWRVFGTRPFFITLDTSTNSGTFTLSKSSGTVSSNNLIINRSTATGGADWYAGSSSANVISNSGWSFKYPPTTSKGELLTLFTEETN